jgi:hypothetical protein
VYSLTITLGYYAYFFYHILTNKPLPPADQSHLTSEAEVRSNDQDKQDDHHNDDDDDGVKDEPRLAFPLRSIRELFPRSGPTGCV